MRTSDNIDLLATALSQAQAEFPSVEKKKDNTRFKSKHSDIDAVMMACLPVLSKYGLCLIQPISNDQGGGVTVTTRIIHKSGQWLEESFTLYPDRKDAQAMGSVVTYGRRYAAKAMLGLADEQDDDGEAATNHPVTQEKKGAKVSHADYPAPGQASTPDPFTFPVEAPKADPKSSFKSRIPKMLEAFKLHFGMDVLQIESMLCKPIDDFDEDDIETLEQNFRDLNSEKKKKINLEAIQDIVNVEAQHLH